MQNVLTGIQWSVQPITRPMIDSSGVQSTLQRPINDQLPGERLLSGKKPRDYAYTSSQKRHEVRIDLIEYDPIEVAE